MGIFKKVFFSLIPLLLLTVHTECAQMPDEQLVFIRHGNIWLINSDGARERQLTNSGDNRNPAISVNGELIVFTSGYNESTGFGSLYSMTGRC